MKRRRKRAHQVSHDRWLVSYADFITLLFAFFVVMYSTSQVDKKKTSQLSAAIQLAFQQLGANPSSAVLAPDIPLGIPAANPTIALPEETMDLSELKRQVEQILTDQIARNQAAVRMTHDGLVISLREGGFFDSGSADIKAGSEAAFSRMAALLGSHPYNLRIEGHTDNLPINNAHFHSNWELSTTRATEVIRLLITKYDFGPQRLSAAGYAEFHPIASNLTTVGRALNRRVDIVVLTSRISDTPDAGAPAPNP